MSPAVNGHTIETYDATPSNTRTVITTNGKRYTLIIHGCGTVGVCADALDTPAFCVVGSVTEAIEFINSHSGGQLKDM